MVNFNTIKNGLVIVAQDGKKVVSNPAVSEIPAITRPAVDTVCINGVAKK